MNIENRSKDLLDLVVPNRWRIQLQPGERIELNFTPYLEARLAVDAPRSDEDIPVEARDEIPDRPRRTR